MRTSRVVLAPVVFLLFTLACGCSHGNGNDSDSDFDPNTPPPPLTDGREFRAIAGVSMGAYGAMNLGTKHPDLFSTIAALGGPLDMVQLLHDGVTDNLEVKAQSGPLPQVIGDDFTFDHLAPYPDRDTRMSMLQDLVLALGNPYLHHTDPNRQYLASDSQPASIGRDDQFGNFTPVDNFMDGGDESEDGVRQTAETPAVTPNVLLVAGGSAAALADGSPLTTVGARQLADLDGDGVYDVGDGIVVNLSEPFTDSNDNLVYEPELGETSMDVGLDGVAGSGDFGEGNGQFDYDPDRAHWLTEDPLSRVAARSAAEITQQRMYLDVGAQDELGFSRHADHFVALLQRKGIEVETHEGFSSDCSEIPALRSPFTFIRYDAGHVGVKSVDPDDLLNGNVCGDDTVWQRLLAMAGYLNESFPDGFFGTGGEFDPPDIDFDDFDIDVDFPDLDPRGDIVDVELESPALANGAAVPTRTVTVYLPPAFFHSDESFPVVYFLPGYGYETGDFDRAGDLFDVLILTGQLQNMFVVFVPGSGGEEGSFYVNHAVPDSQDPNISAPTSGRYEDSLLDDLIPQIEDRILERRVRSTLRM